MLFNIYDRTKSSNQLPDFNPSKNIFDPKLYELSSGLENAVNVALQLGLPLLLTGKPGTGKTQLAYHLAHYFGLGEPLVFEARTTSSATDLFYRYDSLGHFQYTQNQNKILSDKEIENRFIHYAALGEAIVSNKRQIVLIDEIDKAPRDLPNDILRAIEIMQFEVPEINRVGNKAIKTSEANRPIVILTSNSEKNLPDAFLRRVVYYHIPFPNEKMLISIIGKKNLGFTQDQIIILVRHFEALRKNQGFNIRKEPATAELVFWAQALKRMNFPIENLSDQGPEDLKRLEPVLANKLLSSYSVLIKTRDDLESLREIDSSEV